MQSEQQNEQAAGADNQAEAVSEPGIQSLAELLQAGEEARTYDDEAAGADKEAEPGGSHEKAELTKLSSEDGDAITIEQLKDMHKGKSEFELNQLEWEEQRIAQEQDLARAKAELQELFAVLPQKAIKPELLEKIRSKHDAQVVKERKKTMELIPAWKDAKVREADITGMAEHLQGYGFPVNYLQSIVSAQQTKYIRDNWQREVRVRKALEQVRAGKPGKTPASKAQKKPPSKSNLSSVKRGSARNKLEAVFSQLD
jgi:hypothetical protein